MAGLRPSPAPRTRNGAAGEVGRADAAAGRRRGGAYRTLLAQPTYRFWFLAALAAGIGDWAGLVALQARVVELSGEASRIALFSLGAVMMARMLPSALLGPLAGVVADRVDRRTAMVVTNLARGGLFVGIALTDALLVLIGLTLVVELFSMVFLAAKDASLPRFVDREHLAHANQLNMLVSYGPLPIGAALGTAMIPAAALLAAWDVTVIDPAQLALLVNAAAFVVSAAFVSRMRIPPGGQEPPGARSGPMRQLREGLGFVARMPMLRSFVIGVAGVFFGAGAVISLGPAFVTTALGRPGSAWFTMMTSVGVGLVVGLLLAARAGRSLGRERLFAASLVGTAALASVTATLPGFTEALVAGFALGTLAGLGLVLGYTLLQEHTPDRLRGRTFGAFYAATRVSAFAALGIAPLLAGTIDQVRLDTTLRTFELSGVRTVMMLGGLVALGFALAASAGMLRALGAERRSGRWQAPAERPGAGVLVALEGVEGCGKSTQAAALADRLRAEGRRVRHVREPGGTELAERLRGLLADPTVGAPDARAEALLFAAARADAVAQVVRPALADGEVVVSDRSVYSSLAYQGHGRGLGEEAVRRVNAWALAGLLPDVVVLLRMDPSEGAERAARRRAGERADRFEAEPAGFHQRVAEGFDRLAADEPDRVVVVDAAGEPDAVAERVRAVVDPWLPRPAGGDGPPAGRRDAGRRVR